MWSGLNERISSPEHRISTAQMFTTLLLVSDEVKVNVTFGLGREFERRDVIMCYVNTNTGQGARVGLGL